MLEYKGYYTNIKIDFDGGVLYGRIDGIRDYVDFESDSVFGIIQEFHSAVDDYIDFCYETGTQPNIPEPLPEAKYAVSL